MAADDRRSRAPLPAPARPMAPVRRRTKRRFLKRLVLTVIILGLAGSTGFFAYKYNQERNQVQLLANPKAAADQQVSDLVNQVGKLIQLPSGETPTVATVTDISKLKGQAFFAPAENGDKVLIYTKAKKAILYRPSENKVIEISPLSIGSGQTGTSNSTVNTGSGVSQNQSSSQ